MYKAIIDIQQEVLERVAGAVGHIEDDPVCLVDHKCELQLEAGDKRGTSINIEKERKNSGSGNVLVVRLVLSECIQDV